MYKRVIYVFAFFLLLSGVSGDLIISEIMYNPAGNDAEREWIEVYNTGSSQVDAEGWKLRENNINRSFVLEQGSFVIPAGSFLIIVKNYSGFMADYSGYEGNIVSCSFVSLVNSGGEELTLFDAAGNIVNSLSYIPFAPEGYSIELNDHSQDNTNMENWIVGKLNGEPGSIRKSSTPYQENLEDETLEEEPESPESQIPEFGMMHGLLIAGIISMFILVKRD